MRKNALMLLLLLCTAISGCSGQDENRESQTLIKEEIQDTEAEDGLSEASGGGAASEDGGSESAESDPASEAVRPTKEEVLAAREQALEGMSEEEVERLKENVKIANLRMERGYLYEDLFGRLEDPEDLYWNYFDEKGDIQVGWAYGGSLQERKDIMEKENLLEKEFYEQYGTPVTTSNRFHGENFVELLGEMKETVKNEKLQADLQQLMDETELAVQTHEAEHAVKIYQILHDMDYYLLRYGPEDVGKYVQDISLIAQYYGVLSVYE